MVKNALRFKADFSLILVALVWGLTFVTVKNAVADMGPYTFIAIRFAIAFLCLLCFCFRSFLKLKLKELLPGVLIGVFLFSGYAFQTIGLQYTTASNAGFITGISVVLVPIIYGIMNRKIPSVVALMGAGSAAVGLGLLSLKEGYSFNYGDMLVLMCAFSFALHIVFVGRYVPSIDATLLTTIQIGVVALLSAAAGLLFENDLPIRFTGAVWIGLLTTAIPATSLAFLIQNSMQRFTTATHTAIILSMEPVFAGVFGFLVLGEVLGSRGVWGAAFVVLGMILSELREVHREPARDLVCGDASPD